MNGALFDQKMQSAKIFMVHFWKDLSHGVYIANKYLLKLSKSC